MNIKFIGPEYTYTDALSNESIDLKTNQIYDIDLQYDGPQVIVNGQRVFDDNGTFWVVFNGMNIQIPYAHSCLLKQWEVRP